MALIKHKKIVSDTQAQEYVFLLAQDAVPASGAIVVPQSMWEAQRDALIARKDAVGVLVAPDGDPSLLQKDFEHLALIAIDFPKFADGRGYSHARLLRDRYGWTGELRAVGNVLRDQLFYLSRCGFDALALEDDKDAQDALRALDEFSVTYQTAADGRAPVYHQS